MGEFELIARFFDQRPARRAQLGIGDDCALLGQLTPGCVLAVTSDMLVGGRHFLLDSDPEGIGHKALAVNLSDLAAMGARPLAFTLALSLPDADEAWLAAFARGLFALASRHDCELVGGDTTRGPLNICITAFGEVPSGGSLRRDHAEPGDDIWVSGRLGGAAFALERLLGDAPPATGASVLGPLERPQPRVDLGLALRHLARAAIDLSDGLIGDLGHICDRSRVGARIDWESVPLAEEVAGAALSAQLRFALAGGDDYELLFTAPTENRIAIAALGDPLGLPLTRIGEVVAGQGIRVVDSRGRPVGIESHGFDHFA